MQKHMKRNFERHLSLMCKTMMDQNDQIKEQFERIETQEVVVTQLARSVGELKDQFEKERTQRNMDEKLERNQNDINEIRENVKQKERELVKRVDELSEKIDHFLLEHPIANGSKDVQENMGSGGYLWTIHNFSRRLQRIQSGKAEDPIRSEPFYTGSPGYKLCVWIYLNGRGKSLGKAVSVYGRVTAGEFDPILKWPVRPQYTFTVFEQNSSSIERRDIVRTRRLHEIKREQSAKGGGIARPQTDERSIIIGFDDFVTHKELHSRGFLKDDVIFLKVEAEIFD